MNDVMIQMDKHFDLDSTMEAVTRERFAMPPEVIAAFRQAAMQSAQHLLNLVSNKEEFGKLSMNDKMKVMTLIFDRAYGQAETASSSMNSLHKTGQLQSNTDHGDQLTQIEQRMKKHDRHFPEMKTAQRARRRELKGAGKSTLGSGVVDEGAAPSSSRRQRRPLLSGQADSGTREASLRNRPDTVEGTVVQIRKSGTK